MAWRARSHRGNLVEPHGTKLATGRPQAHPPPSTGVAHAFQGGDAGMTLLMYGTREPGEVCYYPRSGKVYFVGLELVTRVGERLDYWDGED